MSNEIIVKCKECGTRNRVFMERVDSIPRCGKCKLDLIIPNQAISIGESDFEREVLEEIIPTVVDFWAPWCGQCKTVASVLEAIAKEYRGRVKVIKVNSDDNQSLSQMFEVHGIPTLLLFRDGKEMDRLIGAASKSQIMKFLHIY